MKIPPLWICGLVIVILLALLIYITTHQTTKESVSRFYHPEPKAMFTRLVSEFGHPQIMINQRKGFAMWFPSKSNPKSPYESIILKDEKVQRYDDGEIINSFLYTTIIIDIPEERVADIVKISKYMYYDRESKELTVRGNTFIGNKHILYAVVSLLNFDFTIEDARALITPDWFEGVVSGTVLSILSDESKIDSFILSAINNTVPKREFILV